MEIELRMMVMEDENNDGDNNNDDDCNDDNHSNDKL